MIVTKTVQVVDERDNPLEGAHLTFSGKGSTTNANGIANIVTSASDKISISYVGKEPDYYQVGNLPSKIIMIDQVESLGEVVINSPKKNGTPKYLFPALGATALLLLLMSIGPEPKEVTL